MSFLSSPEETREAIITADKIKILVIDDDTDLALNLQDILQEEGYTVSVAADGKSALTLCRKNSFGLALVDIKLPDTGGIDLVNKLVSLCSDTEYIMVTGYASLDTAVAAVGQKGIIAYETKPLNMVALLNLIRQVTERQQAQKLLSETEERYRLLAENVDDVIWTADIDLRFTYVSPSACQLLGYASEEVVGKVVEELIAPEYHPLVSDVFGDEKSYRESLTEPKTFQAEALRKDSSRVWVETRWRVMSGSNGKPAYILGVSRDITERKRAEEELRQLSHRLVQMQEEERRAVAAELHDQVGQSLTGLKLLIARAMRSSRETVNPVLEEANAVVSDLMTRVRNLSLDLRPAMLDDLGLLPALLWLFERYTTQTQVKVNFEHSGLDGPLSPQISTAIYRIVQEALTNVSKYAGVDKVTVRAWSNESLVCAQIEDRGKGFNPGEITVASSGLVGMQERAHLLGGRVTIETTPGAGTRVTAELPLSGEPK